MSAAERLPPPPNPAAPVWYPPVPPRYARVLSINHVTEAEYFRLDAATTEGRLEYYDGEIVAMAGASLIHNFIVSNTVGELRNRLKGGNCRAVSSDQRVAIPARRGYVYPDVVAACGKWECQPGTNPAALLNPVVIFEVLSESTAFNDQHRKFVWYQTLPSLRHYALVSTDEVSVLLYSREPGARLWTVALYEDLAEALPLTALEVELPLAEVYNAVMFGEGE